MNIIRKIRAYNEGTYEFWRNYLIIFVVVVLFLKFAVKVPMTDAVLIGFFAGPYYATFVVPIAQEFAWGCCFFDAL